MSCAAASPASQVKGVGESINPFEQAKGVMGSGVRGSMAAPLLRCRELAFPNIWGVQTQGSSDTSSGLGCATHARQQHAHALGPLRAASCERCRACHSHRRYYVHLTLRRAYVVVSVYWCTVGGPGGALRLSTPPTQEEYNYPRLFWQFWQLRFLGVGDRKLGVVHCARLMIAPCGG
jgi:hypothetical protein